MLRSAARILLWAIVIGCCALLMQHALLAMLNDQLPTWEW